MSDIDAIVKDLRLMETKGYGPVGFIRTCAEAATALESHRGRVEVLEEKLLKMCDEFEDATYDRIDGSQSNHRKQLIAECRAALTPSNPPR